MRYMGIDFGSKRVGVAVSDEAGSFAFPLTVLENSGSLLEELRQICQKQNIGIIVVGESKNFSMQKNEIMKEITPFVELLKDKLAVDVVLHPEFLTSQEAERLQGKNDMLDASAAALILKSYLDTQVSKNN